MHLIKNAYTMKKIILAFFILVQTIGMKAQNTECLVIPDSVDFGACAMALGIGQICLLAWLVKTLMIALHFPLTVTLVCAICF